MHSNPLHRSRLVLLALAAVTLPSGPSSSAGVTMPSWFWQQSAIGLLGENIEAIRVVPEGFKVICWKTNLGSRAGVAIPADMKVRDLTFADFIPVSAAYCKVVVGIP